MFNQKKTKEYAYGYTTVGYTTVEPTSFDHMNNLVFNFVLLLGPTNQVTINYDKKREHRIHRMQL